MAFRSKSIFGIALVAAVFAAANGGGEKPKASPPPPVVEMSSSVSRAEVLMRTPGGGTAQQGGLYPSIDAFPTIVDARHANTEAVDLFHRFFATKSRHDSNATMAFISRDLSVYADATLGWELNGYDALREVWAQYMPTCPCNSRGRVNGAGRVGLGRFPGEVGCAEPYASEAFSRGRKRSEQ
jgi:hypothetical protein